MRNRSFRTVLLTGALVAFATLAAAEPDSKWRLKFDHWAETDGELVLRIAPLNGTPIDVSTKISKDTTENAAAELVSGALKAQLGKGYKVEVDDGEDVVIKKSGKTPKFEVTLVSSSVTGLNLKIKH
ncbi:MAG TPA: hypothetical protein VJP84_07430 [Steroidobacteraceae bacterium]|jgi:hypothetical protein|nr:hypothetical protein [Steroidobacteraceae bacterium]